MKKPIKLIATCPNEAKEVLCAELVAIGASEIVSAYRSVHFIADTEKMYYAAHLKLRTASALLRIVKVVRFPTEENLFRQCCRIDWVEIFGKNSTFRVDGIDASRSGQGLHANIVSKKIRQAISQNFQKHQQIVPEVDLQHPELLIVGYNQQHKCIISINTTGQAMHRRGYRSISNTHPAPLKETLAATILQQVGYKGQKPLLDVMCGSGTLAIEAALIALNKAPLTHRGEGVFAFERLPDFDKSVWHKVQETTRSAKKTALPYPIIVSDISEKYVRLAQENAERAQVEQYLQFRCKSYDQVQKDFPQGMVIANLPYGDRLSLRDSHAFYQQVGNWLKSNFVGWEAVLITSTSSPYKHIGLRPSKRYSFYNGNIEILALVYELYAGSKKYVNTVTKHQTP